MNFKAISQFPVIAGWSRRFIGETLTQRKLARRTGDLLRALGHPVRVHSATDRNLERNTVVISAEYHVERDEAGKKNYLSITLVVHPASTNRLKFDDMSSALYSLDIVESLSHEYQHEYQYRTRDFELDGEFYSKSTEHDVKSQEEYLGIPGEIDAFSVNIAIRLWILYGDETGKRLSDASNLEYYDSPDFCAYRDTFGLDHSITRKLIRKISKNIQLLDAWKLESVQAGRMSDNQFAF
jgi:hypothetical protein